MSINNIKDTIQKQVQEKIDKIESETIAKLKKIKASVDNDVQELRDKIENKTKQKIEKIKQQEKTSLEAQKRDSILKRKQELIEESKQNTIKFLTDLGSEDYQKIIVSLLKKIDSNYDNIKIFAPTNRKSETSNALKISKKNFILSLDNTLQTGFVIKDSASEINNSFDKVVDQIFEEREIDIVGLLFSY